MQRVQPAEWTCPVCDARGDCIECSCLGTYEGYQRTQALHEHAIEYENGIAARVLEQIATWPDQSRDRAYWFERMITGAERQIRMGVN